MKAKAFEIKENIVIDIKAYQESDLKKIWTPFREKVIKEGIFYGAVDEFS